jgi:hypothetical protein
MSKAFTQTGAVGLANADRAAKFDVLNGSEIIILAIKPSLWYVLLVSARISAVLLAVIIAAWTAGQLGWIPYQAHFIMGLALAGISIRLAFGLLQWQSRAYILTNIRVLRIRGTLRVEMFQCHLLRLKDVSLSTSATEKLLGLGTIGLQADSPSPLTASWLNVRNPQQVRQQILDAIDALKGHSSDQSGPNNLPPANTVLPAKNTANQFPVDICQ